MSYDADYAAHGIVSLNGVICAASPARGVQYSRLRMSRMPTLTICALLLFASTSHADGAFDFAQAERLRKDKRLEVAGIALTAVGAASYGAGLGLFFSDHSITGSSTHRLTEVDAWALATGVGAIVFLGAGIPLWVVGAHRLRVDRRTTPSAAR